MHCIIVYQKNNGKIFVRTYNYDQGRKIGEETSMGWKVLNVLYECDGNYYQYHKYMRILRKKLKRKANKKIISRTIKKAVYNTISSQLRKLHDTMY
ncbi:MAG: hypothetical protein II625_06135 [Bacilli bacterium]|nr:hypothetical protein [Bacilli bacterium]